VKNVFVTSLIAILIVVATTAEVRAEPRAKVTALVTDEEGLAVEGAEVHISFIRGRRGGWGTDTEMVRGKSNADGIFAAEGEGMPSVSISARKEGFYPSGTGYKFKKRSLLNRWEPWNPTVTVVLKKKRNPVAMYWKNVRYIRIPSFGIEAGYDLEEGDWVVPYGRGISKDLVFKMTVDEKGYGDYRADLRISFGNSNDGIQEYEFPTDEQSYYKWPFEAPASGYQSTLEFFRETHPGEPFSTNMKKNVNYIFRIRTVKGEKGGIEKATYGKIAGQFEYGPNGDIGFTYYYNPDGTRNLEEDPNRNLFDGKK